MKYLLDTTTCIAATKRQVQVVERLKAVRPDDIAIATVTLYELEVGVAKCRNPADERQRIDLFVSAVHVVDFDRESARQAALIRSDLERRGRGIGPYDTLIAAMSLHHGLILVSNNGFEFTRVPLLLWEDWSMTVGTTKITVIDPERLSTTTWWRKALEELNTGKLTIGSPPYTLMSRFSGPAPLHATRLRTDEAAVVATWARTLGTLPFTMEPEAH